MKKRFSEKQIIDFPKEADRGVAVQHSVPAMADSPGARPKCATASTSHRGHFSASSRNEILAFAVIVVLVAKLKVSQPNLIQKSR